MADKLCAVETIQATIWVDDALYFWIANHQVEVTQIITLATRRYRTDSGEWPLRYEVTNHVP